MSKRASEFQKSQNRQASLSQRPPLPFLLLLAAVLGAVALIGYQVWSNRPTALIALVDYPRGITPDGYPYKGNPEAKIIIEEYTDFQCPACARYAREVGARLDEKYVKPGKVYYIFRYFPFLGPESFRAAEAAACATEQGKFWEYEHMLFAHQRGENVGWFSDDRLVSFATQLGLDRGTFQNCLLSGKYRDFIRRSVEAANQRGVQATPTLFINGEKIEGLYDVIFYETYIDTLLQQAQ